MGLWSIRPAGIALPTRYARRLPLPGVVVEKRCGMWSHRPGGTALQSSSALCEEEEEAEAEAEAEGGAETQGSRGRPGKPLSRTKMKLLRRKEQETERKAAVVESFFSFYREQYRDRWLSLQPALERDVQSSCMLNRFADPQSCADLLSSMPGLVQLQFLNIPVYAAPARFPQPGKDAGDVWSYYLLDAASVLATQALQLNGGDRVLDLCAAPGGKSLAILQQLDLPSGSLTANELSEDRRRRLLKVIRDYIPQEFRHCVRVTSRDGTRWLARELYDKILVDAPCSSERHLIHDQLQLQQWTPRRSATLATRQYALLTAALKSVHVSGIVVYSTCSISHLENDGVISKAMRKSKVQFEVVPQTWPIGERTEHGWIVLPDVAQGWGPLYFSALRRLS